MVVIFSLSTAMFVIHLGQGGTTLFFFVGFVFFYFCFFWGCACYSWITQHDNLSHWLHFLKETKTHRLFGEGHINTHFHIQPLDTHWIKALSSCLQAVSVTSGWRGRYNSLPRLLFLFCLSFLFCLIDLYAELLSWETCIPETQSAFSRQYEKRCQILLCGTQNIFHAFPLSVLLNREQ